MSKKIKRLLFTEEPYFDESFIGYVKRLADLNEIPDIRWILKLVKSSNFSNYDYKYSFDFRIDVSILSKITGVGASKLLDLLYFSPDGQVRCKDEYLMIFNHYIHYDLICRENPKICPRCLAEQNYCRKVWELVPITACPIHQCLLIDHCPKCSKKIDWARPKIHLCHCKLDFRETEIFHLKEIELRLSKYLYQQFDLFTGQPEFSFGYPLETLSSSELLKLLLFVGAYFSVKSDIFGNSFFKFMSNSVLHWYLTLAMSIFENWAENYYIFVKDWHKREIRYCLGRKQLNLTDFRFSLRTEDYEIFNFVLYKHFYGKQFAFLRREFENFLEKFIAGDFLEQPSLFHKFD
jgi:hypothetical protein